MVVSFLEESKYPPTTWGPTHELTNNPMGVMFALLHMLMEAILIAKIVDTKMTSELCVSYPFWMIFHVFSHILLVLCGMLTSNTHIVFIFVNIFKMRTQICCSAKSFATFGTHMFRISFVLGAEMYFEFVNSLTDFLQMGQAFKPGAKPDTEELSEG